MYRICSLVLVLAVGLTLAFETTIEARDIDERILERLPLFTSRIGESAAREIREAIAVRKHSSNPKPVVPNSRKGFATPVSTHKNFELAGKAKDAPGKAKDAPGKAKDAPGKAKDAPGYKPNELLDWTCDSECKASPVADALVVGLGTSGSLVLGELLKEAQRGQYIVGISNGHHDSHSSGSFAHFCQMGTTFPPSFPDVTNPGLYMDNGPKRPTHYFPYMNKIHGGASAMNTGVAGRVPDSLWQRVHNMTGFDAWSVENVSRDWNLMEDYAGPDPSGGVRHGSNGPVRMTNFPSDGPAQDAIRQKLSLLTGVPVREDMNDGTILGVGSISRTIAETAPGVFEQQNTFDKAVVPRLATTDADVDILSMTTVTKVLFCRDRIRGNHWSTEPRACAVSVRQLDGVERVIRAKRIIVAAGTPSSIQLMQLSGIGRCADLESAAPAGTIKCRVNNEHVGQGMFDHYSGSTILFGIMGAMNRTGCNIDMAYYISDAGLARGETEVDAGIGMGHLTNSGPLSVMGFLPFSYRGGQRAHVVLRDADPATVPTVRHSNPNEPLVDYLLLDDAISKFTKLVDLLQADGHVVVPLSGPGSSQYPATPAGRRLFIDNHFYPDWHLHGGMALGKVTREDGGVIGTTGLHIADLSLFPDQIPNHGTLTGALQVGITVGRMLASTL